MLAHLPTLFCSSWVAGLSGAGQNQGMALVTCYECEKEISDKKEGQQFEPASALLSAPPSAFLRESADAPGPARHTPGGSPVSGSSD